MLYAVSFSNGVVGVFSSLEKVKELVIDRYNYVTFIIQVFKQEIEQSEFAWIILYKDTEIIAYVSNNKDTALKYNKILYDIGRVSEEDIDYWKVIIDDMICCSEGILEHLNNAYKDTSSLTIKSEDNIIEY